MQQFIGELKYSAYLLWLIGMVQFILSWIIFVSEYKMGNINCVAKVGYSISSTLPSKFNADLDVVGCCIYYSDKILLLQVCPQKDEASLWGVPAGKIEKNEQPKLAAVRELQEETKLINV